VHFHESPALELPARRPAEAERIAALRNRYQVRLELELCAATSLGNYEYLDVLDRSWAAAGLNRTAGGTLCDVGCANVWYAAGLQAFFQPRRLAPDRLFAGVRRNLRARGVFLMVNHGPDEARIAAEYCSAAGLRQVGGVTGSDLLSEHRLQPVVASCWQSRSYY